MKPTQETDRPDPLRAELKNVRICEWMSEETTCFSADLYVDGQRTATVNNDGHGGTHTIHPVDLATALTRLEGFEAWAKAHPPVLFGHRGPIPFDVEQAIDLLLDDWMSEHSL